FGRSEMLAGRYATGCSALEASYRLDPRAGTLFTLAECDLKWGKTASALARYEEYLALYGRMAPEQRAAQAERAAVATHERNALVGAVPRLVVRRAESAAPGTVVQRDDVTLGGPMLGAAMPVDPGEHVVSAQAADGRRNEVRVTLAAGEQRTLVID